MKRGVCGVPLLVLPALVMMCLGLGASLPARAEEPSPVAGNATKAAVPGGEPLAPGETPSAPENAIETAGTAKPEESPSASKNANGTIPPTRYPFIDSGEIPHPTLYLKHIRTYDSPKERTFVLDARALQNEGGYVWRELELRTNVGTVFWPDTLGSGNTDTNNTLEIRCEKKQPGDCAPEALIVLEATAAYKAMAGALEGSPETDGRRHDVRHGLRGDLRGDLPVETKYGPLPPPGSAPVGHMRSGRPEIKVAYEGHYNDHGPYAILRLTFPPGKKRFYKKFYFATNYGIISPTWGGTEKNPAYSVDEEPHLPDTLIVGVAWNGFGVEFKSLLGEEEEEYFLREPNPDLYSESRIFILRALAWTKNGRKMDILPDLVRDPFRPLPVRFVDGPLPYDSGSR